MGMQEVVEYVIEQGYLTEMVQNPMMQFGPAAQNLMGAELLPERRVEAIEYTEEDVRYRQVIASDGTRYNPVQKKESTLVGSRRVRLGHQDIGSDLKASDYDAIVRLLRQASQYGTAADMAAIASRVIGLPEVLLFALKSRQEKQRWECLLHGQVVRKGDDKYQETVVYPIPAGRIAAVGHAWSDPTYDPYPDIMAPVETLRAAGWEVNRIVTDVGTTSILALNPKIQARVGRLSVVGTQVLDTPAGRVTVPELSALFGRDALPPVEMYNRQYRTQTGTGYYFDRGCMFFACTTGRNEEIDRGDLEPLIMENVLGYVGLGPAAGQADPGPVVELFPREQKPKAIAGEAYGASLPVLEEPEAFAALTSIV